MDKTYIDTVRLLLEIAPEVFRADSFAMKGGTALNLFVQDMPRLSVDIDVVYVKHRVAREEALAEIGRELGALRQRLRERGIEVEEIKAVGDETKLFARRGRQEVKIEVNHVFRGTLLPTEARDLVPTARDLFTTALTVPTLAVAEIYGSKLVAAMDRQHPRDFFDVHGMYQQIGLRPDIVECFVGYLAGHNRPVHEVLFSRDMELTHAYENEFEGMAREPIALADLVAVRARLRRDLRTTLTDAHRRFLLGLVAGEPAWDLMGCRHLAELPAVQWKLRNLLKLKESNPTKFRFQTEELQRRFSA
ncbi:MAG: nucleotidyl transferase AbiEii/AbiGii toxin family protein [Lacunisphaera sp.]|nr:nucleotidyl transferase AbiEii/AbiGii toxin family protein [Lacunisphaera sp.]